MALHAARQAPQRSCLPLQSPIPVRDGPASPLMAASTVRLADYETACIRSPKSLPFLPKTPRFSTKRIAKYRPDSPVFTRKFTLRRVFVPLFLRNEYPLLHGLFVPRILGKNHANSCRVARVDGPALPGMTARGYYSNLIRTRHAMPRFNIPNPAIGSKIRPNLSDYERGRSPLRAQRHTNGKDENKKLFFVRPFLRVLRVLSV